MQHGSDETHDVADDCGPEVARVEREGVGQGNCGFSVNGQLHDVDFGSSLADQSVRSSQIPNESPADDDTDLDPTKRELGYMHAPQSNDDNASLDHSNASDNGADFSETQRIYH